MDWPLNALNLLHKMESAEVNLVQFGNSTTTKRIFKITAAAHFLTAPYAPAAADAADDLVR